MTDTLASIPARPVPAPPPPKGAPGLESETVDTGQFWSTEEGPTFGEFLDIINPLQHIPVVSTIYRAITGDEIGAGPRFIGGIVFGGPVGALAAGITSLFEEASGGDLGSHLASLVDDVMGDDEEGQNIAANTPGESRQNAPQMAALPQAAPAAAAGLNRISLNPAAAMGVPLDSARTPPMGKANALFGGFAAPAATPGRADTAAPGAAPVRPMSMPFAAPAVARNADAADSGGRMPGTAEDMSRMNAAVSRSRRQQADLMLAKWAAQQMAAQNQADRTSGSDKQADERNAATAAHPMLPPRDATPEWYAQAMNRALNQYNRAGATAMPAQPAPATGRPAIR